MFWSSERDSRTLDEMDAILKTWARASRIRPKRHISPTLLVMRALENNAKKKPEIPVDWEATKEIRAPEDEERIRLRVDEILLDKSLWRRFEIQQKAIRTWYYVLPEGAYISRFARLMGISNRAARPLITDAVRRFSFFW